MKYTFIWNIIVIYILCSQCFGFVGHVSHLESDCYLSSQKELFKAMRRKIMPWCPESQNLFHICFLKPELMHLCYPSCHMEKWGIEVCPLLISLWATEAGSNRGHTGLSCVCRVFTQVIQLAWYVYGQSNGGLSLLHLVYVNYKEEQ